MKLKDFDQAGLATVENMGLYGVSFTNYYEEVDGTMQLVKTTLPFNDTLPHVVIGVDLTFEAARLPRLGVFCDVGPEPEWYRDRRSFRQASDANNVPD
ncbi:hypothetical protein HDU85_002546 [Gaertneriomyces sp. JEL0708]|nr:hypothetical protein HDU85_002546 [Gaertneriomyces sp. JEL0708]